MNPEFYPLIAPGVTAVGVVVAAVGIWVGYLGRVSPMQVELHKRRLDGYGEYVTLLYRLEREMYYATEGWPGEPDRRPRAERGARNLLRKLARVRDECTLLDPGDFAILHGTLTADAERLLKMAKETTAGKKDMQAVRVESRRFLPLVVEMVDICRECVGTPRLSKGVGRMIGENRSGIERRALSRAWENLEKYKQS